ncbi:MAG: hypothetical protein AAB849_01930 [Patescibacteria group bacterium]
MTKMKGHSLSLSRLIQEINHLQKLEKYIFSKLSKQLNSVEVKNAVDYDEIYHVNRQIFYGSLRGWYELDAVDFQKSNWSPTEFNYFQSMQSYLRKLLEATKLLPSLTYLLWQYNLGRHSEQDLHQQLSILYSPYAEAHFHAVKALKQIKYSE